MERRSTRGRTSSVSEGSVSLNTSMNTSVASSEENVEIFSAQMLDQDGVPDVGGEEVVLNRRGMVC